MCDCRPCASSAIYRTAYACLRHATFGHGHVQRCCFRDGRGAHADADKRHSVASCHRSRMRHCPSYRWRNLDWTCRSWLGLRVMGTLVDSQYVSGKLPTVCSGKAVLQWQLLPVTLASRAISPLFQTLGGSYDGLGTHFYGLAGTEG